MAYLPPSGFVETRAGAEGTADLARFHTSADCPRIGSRDLRAVDKPYSAARCPLCAGDAGSRPTSGVLTRQG